MAVAFAIAAFGAGALMGLRTPWMAAIVVVVIGLVLGLLARRSSTEPAGLPIVLGYFAVSLVATLVLIQAIPYGRGNSNPAVTGEPAWSSPRTRELMVDACFACHSNEVEYPWYSNIAPLSWAVADHVDQGRDAVNYSEFDRIQHDADETIETIEEGSMPPGYFTVFGLHPEANLTDAEVDELIAGLRATPGLSEHEGGDGDGDGDDDDDDDDD